MMSMTESECYRVRAKSKNRHFLLFLVVQMMPWPFGEKMRKCLVTLDGHKTVPLAARGKSPAGGKICIDI